MISLLTGRIAYVSADEVILDVNGVGYQLFVSKSTMGTLMGLQDKIVTMHVETHVREDHIHLFGFQSADEKAWFKKLNAVSGVGAKTAQAILSACPPQRLIGAIAAGDFKALTAAEGVGPKLAQRLVVELKDKVASMNASGLAAPSVVSIKGAKAAPAPETSVVDDVVSALVNLGYDRTLAYQTATRIAYANDNQMSLNDLLKASLKELAS